MTKDELVERVLKVVNDNCMELSLEDYAAAMEELVDDLSSRADAAKDDIRNRDGG